MPIFSNCETRENSVFNYLHHKSWKQLLKHGMELKLWPLKSFRLYSIISLLCNTWQHNKSIADYLILLLCCRILTNSIFLPLSIILPVLTCTTNSKHSPCDYNESSVLLISYHVLIYSNYEVEST